MDTSVTDTIRSYLAELLPELGLELFDLHFKREGHGWVLRVYIDTPPDGAGVNLDQCSAVSRELGQYLDVEDCIPHAYHLEVSSPGLDRPLRSPADCIRFQGELCKVRLHNSLEKEKTYVGKIAKVDGERITLETEQGSLEITWEMVNKARLFFE